MKMPTPNSSLTSKYADALTMCDRYVFFRYLAKHYAAEENLLATFMPKPFADKPGSGAHFNMSLYELDTDRTAFPCPPDETSRGLGIPELASHCMGGMLKQRAA